MQSIKQIGFNEGIEFYLKRADYLGIMSPEYQRAIEQSSHISDSIMKSMEFNNRLMRDNLDGVNYLSRMSSISAMDGYNNLFAMENDILKSIKRSWVESVSSTFDILKEYETMWKSAMPAVQTFAASSIASQIPSITEKLSRSSAYYCQPLLEKEINHIFSHSIDKDMLERALVGIEYLQRTKPSALRGLDYVLQGLPDISAQDIQMTNAKNITIIPDNIKQKRQHKFRARTIRKARTLQNKTISSDSDIAYKQYIDILESAHGYISVMIMIAPIEYKSILIYTLIFLLYVRFYLKIISDSN